MPPTSPHIDTNSGFMHYIYLQSHPGSDVKELKEEMGGRLCMKVSVGINLNVKME